MTPHGTWAAFLVLAALGVAAVWLRRRSPAAGRSLALEERLALSPQCAVATIRVGERRLLISIGGREARLVAELEPVQRPAEPASRAKTAAGGSGA